MDSFDLYIMIYYSLDHYWDKHGGDDLGNFLSGMNPFLFQGEGSAVPDIYVKYKRFLNNREITIENSYDVACEYIACLGEKYIFEAFEWVERNKWEEKCRKYVTKKSSENTD